MKGVVEWYAGLTGYKKFLVSFIKNSIYWGLIKLFVLWAEMEVFEWKKFLLLVTIMALIWTLLYDMAFKGWVKKSSARNQTLK